MAFSTLAIPAVLAAALALTPFAYAQEGGQAEGQEAGKQEVPAQAETYDKQTILEEAESFLGESAEGLADLVSKAFDRYGKPNAFIRGEELAAAVGIGARYGNGTLVMKSGPTRRVYWQSPSIGFDLGANATKVFALVYDLPDPEAIFQRFPGVSGSLYYVAGVGMNYVKSGDVEIAPIRVGGGWRQGVSAGYMHFTREKSWNPF